MAGTPPSPRSGLLAPVVVSGGGANDITLSLEAGPAQVQDLISAADSAQDIVFTVTEEGRVVISSSDTTLAPLSVEPLNALDADVDLVLLSVAGVIVGGYSRNGYWWTRKNAAPADAELASNEMALWFDATNGAAKLMVKAKSANGTVVAGSLALA